MNNIHFHIMKIFNFSINVYVLIPFRFNYSLSCNKIRKISLKKKKKTEYTSLKISNNSH